MAEETKTTGAKTGAAKKGGGEAPIIDLRGLEQTAGAASVGGVPAGGVPTGGAVGGVPTGGAVGGVPTGGAQAAAIAAAQPTGISLEEQALMAGAGAAMGPPAKFTVPTIVKKKFPDLIKLIQETESMNDEERDYWFQILPIMKEDQIKKFRDILINEKEQLARLDKEYEDELLRLNEKHMLEWKEFEAKEKRVALTKKETKAEKEERIKEEELLKRLAGL